MTGGGFGGCTVSLVEQSACETFTTSLKRAYYEKFGIEAEMYLCEAVDGAMPRNMTAQERQQT